MMPEDAAAEILRMALHRCLSPFLRFVCRFVFGNKLVGVDRVPLEHLHRARHGAELLAAVGERDRHIAGAGRQLAHDRGKRADRAG